MSMTDPIADFLTRIRNASMASHRWVDVPASNLKVRMAVLLKLEGYIKDFVLVEDPIQNILRMYLRYTPDGKPVFASLQRVSKPGRRHYVNAGQLPRVRNGLGIAILTTSRGVITDKQARRERVGGEVLCYIW
ncbi:MAG TPA: 30S ribosomal protein S8 [Candidatus Marinimicrobia bacterium]|jgi:small subunit ribosomal protein S8|nr:MAG: 30S ribosomal protein S8 [Candidatus Marinimicrobia bacterium CG1_02_48_14]PIZ69374.1 MAG: 30S ribosomal protein S8 [Candidatus Marinimicrobia bacterium CG_4_10_14_0_2_um_filter_48_9]PJA54076.1 MAG: 30S ribosomal protein S8 [Candidatus Marinimicrobia bacterium CG_4_9_14_3_um_filter_48_9]HCW75806.1 30S ribosomal protein S8 [Candidatus Neomarinimicrobiota bacterium]